MATWHGSITDDEEEKKETLWDKVWGKITGFWGWIVKLLIALFLAWLFFFGMGYLSEEKPERDNTATYDSISEEDGDAVIQREDITLWKYMTDIANSLNYIEKGKKLELGTEKSDEFGAAYFQPSDAIYVKEVKFYDDAHGQRTAEISYEMGVNKNIRFIFTSNHITKEMTRFEGFSETGSFFRYIKWYTYGRFIKGYPRYTCDVDMNNGERLGTPLGKKEVIRMRPFDKIVRVFDLLRRGL